MNILIFLSLNASQYANRTPIMKRRIVVNNASLNVITKGSKSSIGYGLVNPKYFKIATAFWLFINSKKSKASLSFFPVRVITAAESSTMDNKVPLKACSFPSCPLRLFQWTEISLSVRESLSGFLTSPSTVIKDSDCPKLCVTNANTIIEMLESLFMIYL
jgi:hypothetical protein